MFVEGQDSPGIHQVVRRPFTALRSTLPEPIPAGMCVIPSTSEPLPSAAFPVGYAAEGNILIPTERQAECVAGPNLYATSIRT